MKRIITLIIATLLIVSGHTFAEGLARAQVYQEMVQYEAAGFNPARQNPRSWVDDAQHASTKVMQTRIDNAQIHEASDSAASQR
jgi:hypothetical protein